VNYDAGVRTCADVAVGSSVNGQLVVTGRIIIAVVHVIASNYSTSTFASNEALFFDGPDEVGSCTFDKSGELPERISCLCLTMEIVK
jgi:hypothetical protein